MSIKKLTQGSLLLVSITIIITLTVVALSGLINIRSGMDKEMATASATIADNNTKDMLAMNEQLAQAMAQQNALQINSDFARIKGELVSLKGDIESLYRGDGLYTTPGDIKRYEEYIVSNAANLTQEEIDSTVKTMSGSIAMFDNLKKTENKISLAYIVLENGMVFSSSDSFYPAVEKADMRTRDWYKDTISAGGLHWAEIYSGTDDRKYITVATPVYRDKKVWGVVAFDLRVSEISDAVLYQEGASFTDAFIMSPEGHVLLSTKDIEKTAESDAYLGITKQKDVFTNNSGCFLEGNIIAGYSTIQETGWKLVNLLNYEKMLAPVRNVEYTVTIASQNLKASMTGHIHTILWLLILFSVVLLFITIWISSLLARRITLPILELNKGVKIVAGGKLDHFIEVRGGGEIEMLAKSFNKMTCDLLDQMINLRRVTGEKERIGAELGVATHIQASMLPCIFPAFPGRNEFDIYASMQPAKEVGGDFYDFFLVDDNHLAMVMADVSGKGVPAALFMVIAKTLIKNIAQTGLGPKEVLEKANVQLCENNSVEMFVTVWLGILEISTGKIICANAGHEYPTVKKLNGEFELIHDKHGFVLAGLENSKYKEYEIKLEKGDRLFVYTDGVAEATNASNELFGTDRMLDALNSHKDSSSEELLHKLKIDIDEFVGSAPQFDDITMLTLEMKEYEI